MMFLLSTISEALLYVCFALLMGNYILALIPADLKPEIVIAKKYKLLAAAGIAVFSFAPLISLITFLYEDNGIIGSLKSVLLTIAVGKSWIYLLIFSIIIGLFIFFFDHKTDELYSVIGILLVLMLIMGIGWSTHSHSTHGLKGFVTHVIHFTSVVIWVGILLVVTWFSKNIANWGNFLKWFQVTALFCFGIIIVTGLSLMSFTIEWSQYPDSWMIPYGQSLLIKHLLIIPLIGYAFINGVVMKRKLQKDSTFNPRPWTEVELIIILGIFAATGAMSQTSPPHNLGSILSTEGISPLFAQFYDGLVYATLNVDFRLQANGILLLIFAGIFLAIGILSFFRKMPPIFSFIMSLFVVLSTYFAILLSIQIN